MPLLVAVEFVNWKAMTALLPRKGGTYTTRPGRWACAAVAPIPRATAALTARSSRDAYVSDPTLTYVILVVVTSH